MIGELLEAMGLNSAQHELYRHEMLFRGKRFAHDNISIWGSFQRLLDGAMIAKSHCDEGKMYT